MNVDLRYMHCPIFGVCANLSVHCNGYSLTKDPQQKKAPVIQINQEVLHDNLSGYVRKNLESVLNELPDAEVESI